MNPIDEYNLKRYLNSSEEELYAELQTYAPAQKGIKDVWNSINAPIYSRICLEWNWCKVREDPRLENDYDLAVAVLMVLSTRVLHLPIDVDLTLITAIVVKRGLDIYCKCP